MERFRGEHRIQGRRAREIRLLPRTFPSFGRDSSTTRSSASTRHRSAAITAPEPWHEHAVAEEGFLLPAVAVEWRILLVVPLLLVGDESLRQFVAGRVGSARDAPFTLQNYGELFRPAYAQLFRRYLPSSASSRRCWRFFLAYPIGYRVAREHRPRVRRAWIAFLVVMLFLSSSFASTPCRSRSGRRASAADSRKFLGLTLNSRGYAELSIVLGLLALSCSDGGDRPPCAAAGAQSEASRSRPGARCSDLEGACNDYAAAFPLVACWRRSCSASRSASALLSSRWCWAKVVCCSFPTLSTAASAKSVTIPEEATALDPPRCSPSRSIVVYALDRAAGPQMARLKGENE